MQSVAQHILRGEKLANAEENLAPINLLQTLRASGFINDTTAALIENGLTTVGVMQQGDLQCPFNDNNKQSKGDMTCGHQREKLQDPISAERDVNHRPSSPSASNDHCRRCPIRYMDQHTPEEVAEFVEKHKNELPRSHAVCVQRYQRDSLSMRKLDAKYGRSRSSMIRGLGEKHQAFLPGHSSNGGGVVGRSAVEDVSSSDPRQATPEEEEDREGLPLREVPRVGDEDEDDRHFQQEVPMVVGEEDDTDREGHFQRPLREVRVGESPSRPWGIHVPADYLAVHDNDDDDNNNNNNLLRQQQEEKRHEEVEPLKRHCPFHHHGPAAEKGKKKDQAVNTNSSSSSVARPIVFNGPVFFGYSPEQTMAFLQHGLNNVS